MTEDLLVQETSKKQNYTSKLIGVTNLREWWVVVAGSSNPLIPSFFNSFIWRAIPFVLIFGERILTLGIKFISNNGSKLNLQWMILQSSSILWPLLGFLSKTLRWPVIISLQTTILHPVLLPCPGESLLTVFSLFPSKLQLLSILFHTTKAVRESRNI